MSTINGVVLGRPNRFIMQVRLLETSETVEAFCPNTSRLIGLHEGNPEVLMTSNSDPERKTGYTVRSIKNRGYWVGIEASKANDIFERYLSNNPQSPFSEWNDWDRETMYGESQFDFCGHIKPNTTHLTEIKSLSSRGVGNRSAFFSGTPSKRGWRHLRELGQASKNGHKASCVFVIQRPDVIQLAPGKPTHSQWLSSIREAHKSGVSIHALRCHWDQDDEQWEIDSPIPVLF